MRDLAAEVLEEFCDAGAVARQERFEAEARYVAERTEEERERDRERKADQRDIRAILAEIRRLEGIEERFCACGCGIMFPVVHGPGRPQEYATVRCKWRAVKRAARKRVLSIVSHPYSRTSCPLGEGVGGEGDRTGGARTE